MSYDDEQDAVRRRIIDEAIGESLRQLHVDAGRPSARRIATLTGRLTGRRVSAGTVENALKSRGLVGHDNLIAIVEALGGDCDEFRTRWNEAYERIKARKYEPALVNSSARSTETLPAIAASTLPPDGGTAPYGDAPSADVAGRIRRWWRKNKRRRVLAVVLALSLSGVAAIWIVADLPPFDSEHVATVTVEEIGGEPVYFQCSTRARSILSQPGKTRGGVPVGELKPNERFVVNAKTSYWRRGYVQNNPALHGWVMSTYLCPTQAPA